MNEYNESFQNQLAIQHAIQDDNYQKIRDIINEKSNLKLTPSAIFIIEEACFKGFYESLKLVLDNNLIDLSVNYERAIMNAASAGHLNVLKLLLENKKINPSKPQNWSIILAHNSEENSVCDFLWKDKRVRYTLFNDDPILAKKLNEKFIKEKIYSF